MKLHKLARAVVVLCFVSAHGVQAQETDRPELLSRLIECRAQSDAGARLICYDEAVNALDTAERQGDVVLIDRAQVHESRRALFGFDLPTFGRMADEQERFDSVETTLDRATRGPDNKWIFRLTDGSVWRQIGSESVFLSNREGAEVRIRQAMLGSYMLTVGNSRAIRVRREQ